MFTVIFSIVAIFFGNAKLLKYRHNGKFHGAIRELMNRMLGLFGISGAGREFAAGLFHEHTVSISSALSAKLTNFFCIFATR